MVFWEETDRRGACLTLKATPPVSDSILNN
jgi:hypothetical protein